MSEKAFGIISIIAARKTKLYEKIRDKVLEELPPEVDEQGVRECIEKAIAALDNNLLIGASEKATGTINPYTPIEELRLNVEDITRQVLRLIED